VQARGVCSVSRAARACSPTPSNLRAVFRNARAPPKGGALCSFRFQRDVPSDRQCSKDERLAYMSFKISARFLSYSTLVITFFRKSSSTFLRRSSGELAVEAAGGVSST